MSSFGMCAIQTYEAWGWKNFKGTKCLKILIELKFD